MIVQHEVEHTVRIPNQIDFFEALTLVFVVFKLLGRLDWNWAQVLAPYWLPIAVDAIVHKLEARNRHDDAA